MNHPLNLQCTAFEELMLSQDSEAYPCNIYLRMTLDGQLDRDKFTESVKLMLVHHPMLRAQLRTGWGRSRWCIQEVRDPTIVWRLQPEQQPEQQLSNLQDTRIKLDSEAGIHIDVVELREPTSTQTARHSTQITVKLHHAIADGMGLSAAILDMWLAYDALISDQKVKLPKRSAASLPVRNRFAPGVFEKLRLIPQQYVGLAGIRQYLSRQPTPIVLDSAVDRAALPAPSFDTLTYPCSQGTTESLTRVAKREGISLNVLLAACIFRGVSEYQAVPGTHQQEQWLRMMVPVNLRHSELLQQLPACNIVSCVFLDRTHGQISDFASLTRGLHEELELIKRKRLALLFILSVWIRNRTSLRKKQAHVQRCQTSFVFSNLGKVFSDSCLCDEQQRIRAGNVRLESIEGFAPVTPWMDAAFTSLIYARQLKLMLRFDSRVLKSQEAGRLMAIVTKSLELLAQQESTT